jgi:molybdate transport system substrate-binding protein
VGEGRIRSTLVALAVIVVSAVSACSSDTPTTATSGAASEGATGPITVFAAASLTESFTEIGKDFEAANPGSTVTFNFAGSSTLAAQINEGAPADLFAAASPATMKTVTDAGNGAGSPVAFGRNQLVIAVPKGNPKGIAGLSDLNRSELKIALCAEQVPCGAAARKTLDAANVALTPATLEQDVKGALSKVKLGEVDAALVYRTDAKSAVTDVDGVEFPESASAINDYVLAQVRNARNPAGASAFLAYVRSEKGQAILAKAGFQAP